MTTPIAFDTETFLMAQGDMAPNVVCVSIALRSGRDIRSDLWHWTEAEAKLRQLFEHCLQTKTPLVGHNTAYDMACIVHTWSSLNDLVWQLYDNELVHDTIVRQKLSDLARGRYRGFRSPSGFFVPLTYDLAAVTKRHTGEVLEKDEWRLRYGELSLFPLDQWPQAAKDYSILDAVSTLKVWESQEADSHKYPEGPWFFVDQHPQVRASWWLHLTAVRGIMTSADAVERLKVAAEEEIENLEGILVEKGLVEITHCKHRGGSVTRKATRKLNKVRARVLFSCREQGKLPRFSNTGKEVIAAKAKGEVSRSEKGKVRSGDLSQYICIDKDACLETGDPLLEAYIDYSSALKTLNTDCEAYARGVTLPLHTRFESLAATGRTTSSGQSLKDSNGVKLEIGTNIQNVRWNFPERCTNKACRSRDVDDQTHVCKKCGSPGAYPPGIRECFVPRPGWVFASSDYDGLELRTLAQVCLRTVGYSRLAEVLNSPAPYNDPHLMMAASILGISYEEALKHKKDPRVQLARQTGKVANFGFPGGLGAEKLVLFARMSYRVRITEERAKELKRIWLKTFPEFRDYFKYIESLENGDGEFTVEHLFSRRLRSKIFYTVACNSLFQGLGADAAKAAGYLIARACYYDRESPLYGCHTVNYIHDEWILEVPDDGPDYARATAAAKELSRLMIVGAASFLPDVPATTEPQLMRRWSKKAKTIWVDGHLVPWDLTA